jgi:ABC-type nitrate/sulfonate/bicarbonate transport system substrate-binding protein
MVSSLTYFVAMEKGYFLDEKILVEAGAIKTSDGLAEELISGNIDLAVELAIVPLLEKTGKAGPQYAIFSTSKIEDDNTAFDAVLVKTNSNIAGLGDLAGRKVALFPGSTARVCFTEVFKDIYPTAQLPILETSIKPAEQLNALMRGDVDAVHAYEPILTIGLEKFGLKQVFGSIYAAQFSPNPIGVGALNRAFVKRNPELAHKVMHAMDRAVKFIETNPGDARAILAQYTGAELSVAEKMRIMPMSLSTEIDRQKLEVYIKLLADLGLHKQKLTAEEVCIKK